jgi:hypothetical protein
MNQKIRKQLYLIRNRFLSIETRDKIYASIIKSLSPFWKNSKKANLFIIGAQKSATTSLHDLLVLSATGISEGWLRKETHYFDKYYKAFSETAFTRLFSSDSIYRIDSSPSYIFDPSVAKRIFSYNSESKLILILRDPVKRAVSHYRHNIKIGHLDVATTFQEALEIEEKMWDKVDYLQLLREEKPLEDKLLIHSYFRRGLYENQLNVYRKYFDEENILIIDFKDLINNDPIIIQQIEHFLGGDIKLSKDELPSRNSFAFEGDVDDLIVNALRSRYSTYVQN